jgi:hypothetical protein
VSEPIELRNEFASVTLEVVQTRNGERLRIFAPRSGKEILLDPVELESLTWQSHGLFSTFLEDPFGPDDFPLDDGEGEPGGR